MSKIQNVGKYDVDEGNILGSGSFGKVYLALNRETGEQVAAKKVETDEYPECVASVMKEVDALKQIPKHPNIVNYHGYERTKGCLWIFCDFCKHGDLSKYTGSYGLHLPQKVSIMRQCTDAIAFLHGRDPPVAHRDLKPENVMMDEDDKGHLIAKIGDFGLARAVERQDGKTLGMTTFCGTPYYFSPEIFDGISKEVMCYTRSVDTFALGMLFVSLLNVKPGEKVKPLHSVKGVPLGQTMWLSSLKGHFTASPVTFPDTDSEVELKVKRLAEAMISFNPEDRPTPNQVLERIKTIAGTCPLSNVDAMPSEPTNRPAREAEGEEKAFDPVLRPSSRPSQSGSNDNEDTCMLVIVGGATGLMGYEMYDKCWGLDGRQWIEVNTLPREMQCLCSSVCQTDNGFVVVGGSAYDVVFSLLSGMKKASTCYQYITKHGGKWKQMMDMPTPRSGVAVVVTTNDCYAMGGRTRRNIRSNVVECLNLEKNTWEEHTSMPEEVIVESCTALHGKIYASSPTHMHCYNPGKKEWNKKAAVPLGVSLDSFISAVGVNNDIYMLGGKKQSSVKFTPQMDTWTVIAPPKLKHIDGAAVFYKGKILLLGGGTDAIEAYDLQHEKWQEWSLKLPKWLHWLGAVTM